MLTRTATVIRKNRRRSSTRSSRRGSAPTVLQPANPSPIHKRYNSTTRTYLTPQPSPSKSVTFSFDSEGKISPSGELISTRQVM
ncbi:hypothetical protein FSP39_007041 [Pinctada imbricata]|uniref:Uncharacterized protein n=1 Tax=Pinctada imbricata TaxID=66713 RepID=A0AA88Y7Q9_PINIB|nr:hypothetical protein FSP39_007041 [Pinctada imbricata]